MKTNANVTGSSGKVKLVFGIYGLKNFCKRMGCEPTIGSILPAFQGGTRLEAISELIRSGMEQASADNGDMVFISDYQACEILETATENEAEKVIKAFLSSIVGQDYDDWFNNIVEEAAKRNNSAEQEDTDDSEKKSDLILAGTT